MVFAYALIKTNEKMVMKIDTKLIKIGKILEQVRPDVALKHHQIHAVTGCDN